MGIAIGMVVAMCFGLGMTLYGISNGTDDTITALSIPIILAALTFVPLMASNALTKEFNKGNDQE